MLNFRKYLLGYIAKEKLDRGFTLLELLIVVIIVGLLAAIALPNMLEQAAKGRQAQAITNLGAINRAQQAYRYEKGTFGSICLTVNVACTRSTGTLPVKVGFSPYYQYSDKAVPSAITATYYADVLSGIYDNDLKDYAASVGLTSNGVFSSIICGARKANMATGSGTVDSTNGTTCGSGAVKIQ